MLQCTDRLAYLSRSLVSCFEFLLILLFRQLSSSTTTYVQYLSPMNSIHTGRRKAVRFEQEKANHCCIVDRHHFFFFLQDFCMHCMLVTSFFHHVESSPFCN